MKKVSANTVELLRSMIGADKFGTIDNRNWWGWAGRRVQRAAAIRAGWIETKNATTGRQTWTVTDLGRIAAGDQPLPYLADGDIHANLTTSRPLGSA